MMKSICLVVLLSAFAIFAGTATATVTVPVPVITDSSTTVNAVADNVLDVVAMVKGLKAGSISLILFIAAIIKLFISLLRLPALAVVFNSPKMKPLKPYIALVLGMLSGFIACVSTGQSLLVSIVSGVVAGFGATGLHETLKSLRGKNA